MATLQRYSDVRLAAILFVAGWASFWAAALNVVAFVPLWLALACTVAGLVMLPFALPPKLFAARTEPLAEQPANL